MDSPVSPGGKIEGTRAHWDISEVAIELDPKGDDVVDAAHRRCSDEAVLGAFGLGLDALLGRGGEASIYDIGHDRVLRLLHPGGDADQRLRNEALLAQLTPRAGSFQLPEILDMGEIGGRFYAIERRLPGHPLSDLLETAAGLERDRLIEAYLEAARCLGDLGPEGWPFYGELAAPNPVRAATWREFLALKASRSLAMGRPPLHRVDAAALAADLPEPHHPEFVHLDAFPGNVLTDGVGITAVLDIGHTCVAGDRCLDPLAAAVYLEPPTSPFCIARDQDVAGSWLRSAGLLDLLEPARRWIAAYWAFAVDEVQLQEWCRSVLEHARPSSPVGRGRRE